MSMEEEPTTLEQIQEALDKLVKKGLIDVFIDESGEWIYKPTKSGIDYRKARRDGDK